MKTRPIIAAVFTIASTITGFAATLTVDDDHAQCPGAQYSSIQAAVNAAKAGDTINVCPGTYPEQVMVTKKLNINGVNIANQGLALIDPANVLVNSTGLTNGSPVAAVVLADGTSDVNLTNLTVDAGNNQFTDSTLLVGIYYRNASGKVDSVAVRNVELQVGSPGAQTGYGIFAQSGNGGSANLQVTNSSVHDYQKNGIVGQEAATQLTVKNNAVSGLGATPNIAQNGIELAFGAKGTVDSNLVIDHIYSQCTDANNCPAASTNILLFQTGNVKVTNNNTGKSQINIALVTNNAEANNNFTFKGEPLYGVYVVGNSNKVHDNSIFKSDTDGVYIDGANNAANNNTINEAPVGVFQTAASTGTNTGGNKFYNVGTNTQTAPSMSAMVASPAGDSGLIETPARP
jgi:hypothetical protein